CCIYVFSDAEHFVVIAFCHELYQFTNIYLVFRRHSRVAGIQLLRDENQELDPRYARMTTPYENKISQFLTRQMRASPHLFSSLLLPGYVPRFKRRSGGGYASNYPNPTLRRRAPL
ncbi:MAG: hypothetical protein ABW044_03200, partial [Cellvibrio sp.]